MDVLVIGGGVFLGPQVVISALRRDHKVTMFRRGRSSSWRWTPPCVRVFTDDRERDLGIVSGRGYDAVFDMCGYIPSHVAMAADVLRTSLYVFMSSISVYENFSIPCTEHSKLHTPRQRQCPDLS